MSQIGSENREAREVSLQRLPNRAWHLGIIGGGLLLLAVVWFGVTRSDPTYQGRPLSYWIRELETKPGRDEYLKAKEALLQLGLVAAPRLAKLLDYQEPKLVTVIREHMPKRLRNLLISRLPALVIRSRAMVILREMGSKAHTAVPVLIRLVKSPDAEARLWAMQILGLIGPTAEPAVPVLVTMLRSGSVEEREAAGRSLGAIGTSAAKAIPELLSAMKAKRIPLTVAVPALVALGHSPVEAVPLLIAGLRASSNSPMSPDWLRCFGLIGPPAAPAVPALTDALQNPDSRTRAPVALALGQIGPSASNAVPALTQTLADEWWYVRENAAIALGKLGSNAASAIPELAKLAQGDQNADVRKAAAEAINSIKRSAVESPAH